MYKIWLMIVILLTFVELMTINLTTIWFVISGIIVLFLSFIIEKFVIQFSVFVLLGIILLLTTRPILKKYFSKFKTKTNVDRIIGMRGLVITDILEKSYGEVKVDGKIWTAYSDKSILKNSYVTILKIVGNKLEVEEE